MTDQSIDSALTTYTFILIKFYSPSCGHCQHLAPIYEAASVIVSQSSFEAEMAEIDVTKERESASKYEIHAYPTMILFINGEAVDRYKGTRTAEAISDWLLSKAIDYQSNSQ